MKTLVSSFILTLFAFQSYAQPVGNKPTAEMKHKIGDEQTVKKDAYTALEWYLDAYDHDNTDADAVYKIASTHESLRDYKNAAEWYQKLVDLDKDHHYPLSRYQHAKAMKMTGDYEGCINEFMAFINEYGDDEPKADYYKTMAQVHIDGAKWAENHLEPKEELIIENVGPKVNSPSTEGGAFPSGRHEIIYTSLMTDTIIIRDEDDDHEHANIYIAKSDDEGEWLDPEEFHAEKIQVPGLHIIEPTFNKDHTKFYFVRAELVGNHMEHSRIYVCDYDEEVGLTGEPISMSFNDPEFACQDPALAVWNGKNYLIFSSNMDGGKGGMDLWYAELNDDGTTKEPLNLESINTIGDEITPYFDERDGHLYFSSDGYPGFGGWDIFRSTRSEDGSMGKVVNLGAGFNTYVDDFHFVVNKRGNDDCYGYILSNRPGTISMKSETCCDDIFSVIMPERCDIVCNIDIIDESNGEPLIGATVQLIDVETGKVLEEQMNKEGNDYTFLLERGKKYEVRSSKESHENGMTPIDVTKATLEAKGFDLTKPIEFDDEVKQKELGVIVKTFDKKTNEALSGVTVTVSDAATDEVIKKLTVSSGNEFKFAVPRNKDYKFFAKKEGYIAGSKTVSSTDLAMVQNLYLTPPPVFYNVYFNFDKSNIRDGAKDTLDMVAKTLMENDDMVVEVLGHTDSKGSDLYNDKLSIERSNNAIKYLMSLGIESSRMIAKGLGEKEPVADNEKTDGSDNPEGRQLNRRVEFKIVSMGSIGMIETEKKN